MKSQNNDDNISQILNDSERIRQVIQTAIEDALYKHKVAGNPVCGLKDGKVYWLEPENIPIRGKQT